MTNLQQSQTLSDRWTYVQDTEPVDDREGVRWVDTSGSDPVVRIYSTNYGDWLRETRVWVQDTQPNPRVGPLDGDRWVDTSSSDRRSLVYSTDAADWVDPFDVQWSEISGTSTTGVTSASGGYSDDDMGSQTGGFGAGGESNTYTCDLPTGVTADGVEVYVNERDGSSGDLLITEVYTQDLDGNYTSVWTGSRSVASGGSDTFQITHADTEIEAYLVVLEDDTTVDGWSTDHLIETTPHKVTVASHDHVLSNS